MERIIVPTANRILFFLNERPTGLYRTNAQRTDSAKTKAVASCNQEYCVPTDTSCQLKLVTVLKRATQVLASWVAVFFLCVCKSRLTVEFVE